MEEEEEEVVTESVWLLGMNKGNAMMMMMINMGLKMSRVE